MQDTLNLRRLFLVIRRYFLLILAFMVIFGCAGFVYSSLQKNAAADPVVTYQADTKLYFTLADHQNDKTDSYKTAAIADLVTSNQMDGAILQRLGLEDIGAVGSISAVPLENSTTVTLSVTNPDEALAVQYTREIAEVLVEHAKGVELASSAQVIAEPAAKQIVQMPPAVTPRSTQSIKTAAIFLVVGLFLGLACAFFINYLQAKLYDAEETETLLGLPIIARIHR